MGKAALVLLNFFSINPDQQRVFVNLIDEHLDSNYTIITDSNTEFFTNNISVIKLTRGANEDGTEKLLEELENYDRFVLFKNYNIENALWFLPFINLNEKLIVVKSKGKLITRAIDWLNKLLSFNSINANENMIVDREVMRQMIINKKDMFSFITKIKDSLSIYEDSKESIANKLEELKSKILDKRFWKYLGISAFSYVANLGTFFAASLAMSNVAAATIAGEIGTLTNFFGNENITFNRAHGFKALAKYNAFALVSTSAQIAQVALESGLSKILYPINLLISLGIGVLIIKKVWSPAIKEVNI